MAHPRDILQSLDANARRSFSQNFLTSPHWIERLASAAKVCTEADEIWEIGPGLGAITQALATDPRPLTLFEIDRKLAARLRELFPQVRLIEGDVLESDFSTLSPGKRIALLSNLPYHLSSAILFQLIDQRERFTRLVLTFQKEFAERLIAQPRTKPYGSLSVLAQLHFRMESLGVLPGGAFYPAPDVASEALVLIPKQPLDDRLPRVAKVVKAGFAHRRKKLARNLAEVFPEVAWAEKISQLGFSEMVRPEELTKEHYLTLSEWVTPEDDE